jgi:Protein of unknown function (DUF1194)
MRTEPSTRSFRPRSVDRWLAVCRLIGIATITLVVVPIPSAVRSTPTVDLVLVLALDVSASVDAQEFKLQRQGLVDAFFHPDVVDAIARLPSRRAAVAVIQWAGANQQTVSIGWTIVRDAASAEVLSKRLAAMPRRYFNSKTDIAGLIIFAAREALSAPFTAARRVIDISGDGVDNVQFTTHEERDIAVRAGLTINGLAIANENPMLDAYYRHFVIGGPGAFVFRVHDYEDYRRGILLKLIREINTRFSS